MELVELGTQRGHKGDTKGIQGDTRGIPGGYQGAAMGKTFSLFLHCFSKAPLFPSFFRFHEGTSSPLFQVEHHLPEFDGVEGANIRCHFIDFSF